MNQKNFKVQLNQEKNFQSSSELKKIFKVQKDSKFKKNFKVQMNQKISKSKCSSANELRVSE